MYASTTEMVWGSAPCEVVATLLNSFPLKLSKDSVIMDAGCGEGRHLPLLASTGARVFGCDYSVSALKKVVSEMVDEVSLLSCRMEAIPLLSNSLDFVLAVDLFETLPLIHMCLSELHRCLKPGGYLFCNLPDSDEEIAGVDMAPVGAGEFLYKGSFFYRYSSSEETSEIFKGAGFQVGETIRRSWREGPHPNFRPNNHTHSSIFYLLKASSMLIL